MAQSPLLNEVLRLSAWLAVLVAVFVPLERLFAVRPGRVLRKGVVRDLCYFFLNGLLLATLLAVPMGLVAAGVRRVVPAEFLAEVAALPLWARLLAAFVAGEIGYYWGHRWCHVVPFLWRFHSVHHAAEEMDFLVHTRNHPLDLVFGRFCGLVPIYLLGLGGPLDVDGTTVPVAVALLGTAWGFFVHANLRWRFGPLEWLVSTPAFHHWHHTRSGPIDRNYSSTLPGLDWLFGSLYLPKNWPADYGTQAVIPEALVDQLAYPLFPAPAERGESSPGRPPGPGRVDE